MQKHYFTTKSQLRTEIVTNGALKRWFYFRPLKLLYGAPDEAPTSLLRRLVWLHIPLTKTRGCLLTRSRGIVRHQSEGIVKSSPLQRAHAGGGSGPGAAELSTNLMAVMLFSVNLQHFYISGTGLLMFVCFHALYLFPRISQRDFCRQEFFTSALPKDPLQQKPFKGM